MQLQDHQVEIRQYARDLEEELSQVEGNCRDSIGDWVARQLELLIWCRSDYGSNGTGWKAELLLSFGGPTVSIDLDSRYETSTLWHSWGAKANGEAQTSTELYSRALHEAVNDIVEMEVLNNGR
tara:strand:- start:139 stop:510 length:372 start_codon:yes stop_codon:yes gene_type:complete